LGPPTAPSGMGDLISVPDTWPLLNEGEILRGRSCCAREHLWRNPRNLRVCVLRGVSIPGRAAYVKGSPAPTRWKPITNKAIHRFRRFPQIKTGDSRSQSICANPENLWKKSSSAFLRDEHLWRNHGKNGQPRSEVPVVVISASASCVWHVTSS